MTTYTTNYDLAKYEPTDLPNLTDQYNESMDIIDSEFKNADGKIIQAETAAMNAQTAAANANTTAEAANTLATNAATAAAAAQTAADNAQADADAAQAVADAAQAVADAAQTTASNAASGAATAQNGVNDLNVRVTALENSKEPTNYTVLFGDSWTAFSYPDISNWIELANYEARTKTTVKNFGVNGAGYLVSNNLMATQVTTANTQMTQQEKASTKYVILLAGVNDLKNENSMPSQEEFSNAIISVIETCNQVFPNAQILFAPNCGTIDLTTREITYAKPCLAAKMLKYSVKAAYDINMAPSVQNVIISKNLPYFWIGKKGTDIMNADHYHPNQNGAKILGNVITNAILKIDNPVVYTRAVQFTDTEQNASFDGYITSSHTGVDITGLFSANSAFSKPVAVDYQLLECAMMYSAIYGFQGKKAHPSSNISTSEGGYYLNNAKEFYFQFTETGTYAL